MTIFLYVLIIQFKNVQIQISVCPSTQWNSTKIKNPVYLGLRVMLWRKKLSIAWPVAIKYKQGATKFISFIIDSQF